MASLVERIPFLGAKPSPFNDIPGSDALIELAHLIRNPTAFFHDRFNAHGPVFKSRFVFPVVFLVGADANKTILITSRPSFSFGQGYAQTAVRHIFENSIMLMDGDQHKHARDLLSPAVGKLAIRESSEQVAHIWGAAAERLRGTSRDVYDVAQTSTFDVVANVLTGLGLGAETDLFRPHFEDLIGGIMSATGIRFPYGRLDRALKARKRLMDMMRPRVQAARKRDPVGLVGQLAHNKDEKGKYLEEDAITAHLLLLFWAGYDTTASAASWIIHMLAQRPDWQHRLREESKTALAGAPLTPDNQASLVQSTWFLYEIERMYPSALFFPRIALEDFAYKGYTIPRGTPVFYSPYMSHRDPATFENPNSFQPERWDPQYPGRHAKPADLVGFGGGARVCLGKSFAQLQLKIMINELLSRYRIEPVAGKLGKVMGLPVHHPDGSFVNFQPV